MENKIEKPTILKLKELEKQIVELINNSDIPAFVLKPTFEKILNQLEIIEQQELENETKKYNELIKEGDNNAKN